jgi:DGQHR domain-containing protein
MQHRLAGFQRAIVERGAEELANFPLLVTIADGLTRMEEIKQFEVINTTQKKVQTDLAHNLLAAQYRQDGIRSLRDARDAWKARAAIIAAWLNENSSVFRGRVIMPNTAPSERRGAVARQTSLDQSLKPVLTAPYIQAMGDEIAIARLIDSYWQAIAAVWPDAVKYPETSLIMKSSGMSALHAVLPQVVEICREKHYGLDKPGFLKAIQGWLHHLGPDWWDAGNREGAAGFGSSGQGHALLAHELSKHLPRLEYESYE